MARSETMVCIVDDDYAVRDSLKRLLELQSFHVETFDCCQKFLASGAGENLACLILDIEMPVMNGFDLMQALAATRCKPPTILVTGSSNAAVRRRATELGVVALLYKPVDPNVLVAAIGKAIAAV